jgi:cytoskeletal protein CcmA (bactofilin family)
MASKRSDSTSVISAVTEITGNISGDGTLRVEGKVKGAVSISGGLSVAEGAVVTGDVRTSELHLEGTLEGDVESDGPVVLGARSSYRGTLRGERVSVQPGAAVFATLDTPFDLNLDI